MQQPLWLSQTPTNVCFARNRIVWTAQLPNFTGVPRAQWLSGPYGEPILVTPPKYNSLFCTDLVNDDANRAMCYALRNPPKGEKASPLKDIRKMVRMKNGQRPGISALMYSSRTRRRDASFTRRTYYSCTIIRYSSCTRRLY